MRPEDRAGARDERADTADDRIPSQLYAAVVLVAVQAAAIAAIAVFLLVKLAFGTADSVGRAFFGALLALGTACLLAGSARALARRRPAARSPVVVIEVLALPVGFSLGVQAGRVFYGGPILLLATAVLVLLFSRPVSEVLYREPGF